MILPIDWFFSFWTFSLPMTSSTLPQPLYRSHIKPCICQYWNPCMISCMTSFSSFPHWPSPPLIFLVYFSYYLISNNPVNSPGPIKYLSYFFFIISLLVFSLPLFFSLSSLVNHYTNSLFNALNLFPLPYYIVFTCLQSWLKSILCLLHDCICLVGMTREKHTIMLTGFTLCSWLLTLSGSLILSTN